MLQYHFNWHQLSAMAGITFYRFYFRLFPGAIKGPQAIEFLHALGRHVRRKVLVIWDGLLAHRSQLVRHYVESLNGAIQLEYLPAYAPELNSTEYIWGHLKQHELGNFCARTSVSSLFAQQPPALDAASLDSGYRLLAASRIAYLTVSRINARLNSCHDMLPGRRVYRSTRAGWFATGQHLEAPSV